VETTTHNLILLLLYLEKQIAFPDPTVDQVEKELESCKKVCQMHKLDEIGLTQLLFPAPNLVVV
jgi:hypothetical protein